MRSGWVAGWRTGSRRLGYPCDPFNASKRPTTEANAERYPNLRAEADDGFRTMLVQGEVALPYDPMLEEIRTCRAFTNSSGRLQVISKKEWKEVLGQSPDRLDACVIAVAGSDAIDFAACAGDGRIAS